MDPSTSPQTRELLELLRKEEQNLNAAVQIESIAVCGELTKAFLDWQSKSKVISDLSFSAADITSLASVPIYNFLNQEDDVPLDVKVALCKTVFGTMSPSYLETTHQNIKEARIEARRPASHWEKRRWRLRFAAHDLVLSQLNLLYQTLAHMGYTHYASHPVVVAQAQAA